MTVWLVTEKPDHPVLAAVVTRLRDVERVLVVDPTSPPPTGERCDLMLLKSYSPVALALARSRAASGTIVVNDPDAVEAVIDRAQMADRLARAGVQCAPTTMPTTIDAVLLGGFALNGPAVIKSRYSRGGDLVVAVDDRDEIRQFANDWGAEPVVIQPRLPNDGVDHKVWVIGTSVFHARRASPLRPGAVVDERPSPALARDWSPLVDRLRAAFGLEIFGFDVIDTPGGPVVVDVNSFPGVRGVDGAVDAFVAFARNRLRGTHS